MSNLKITVATLLGLFILTFFGTLYQVENGLYAAQEKYFYSWFFMLLPFLPFPGVKLWLSVLTLNVIAATFTRYQFIPKKYGILLIHFGIILLLLGSFVLYFFAKESYVAINEGEATGASFHYYDSDVMLWREETLGGEYVERIVSAYDANKISIGEPIIFAEDGVRLIPEYYYKHARPASFGESNVLSTSGLTALVYAKPPLEREQILPGGLFLLEVQTTRGMETQRILLWEADADPYVIDTGDGMLYLRLQRKRYPLPFVIKLNDFIKEEYYDTTQAKNYESRVEIIRGDVVQESRIYMNNPLRTDHYTFFQASFAQDGQGNQRSILAVVYNRVGFWFPYVASIFIVSGLMIHFIIMFVQRVLKNPAQRT